MIRSFLAGLVFGGFVIGALGFYLGLHSVYTAELEDEVQPVDPYCVGLVLTA
jgi:hypothetical protein